MVEVSGIKGENNFKEVSKLDIDFISLGDLTKNISSIDFSLNFNEKKISSLLFQFLPLYLVLIKKVFK